MKTNQPSVGSGGCFGRDEPSLRTPLLVVDPHPESPLSVAFRANNRGDLASWPCRCDPAAIRESKAQRLWPRPMPRIPAFRRSALSVRFIFLAMSGRGVRAFECVLSSRTSSLVHGLRWAEVFFGTECRSGLVRSGSFRSMWAHPLCRSATRSNGYSLRLALADCRFSRPSPTLPRFLNDTTVPGARLPAEIRRRPVPVST